MSLAMRHKARMMGREHSRASSRKPVDVPGRGIVSPDTSQTRSTPAASAYDLKRAELGEDLRALSDIQSIEKKIARKAELLPKYDDWCEGVMDAARTAEDAGKLIGQDDVLVQTMIWAIDTGDAERALPRARLVLRHGMELPSRFERTVGCMIAEEFAETAMKTMNSDQAHVPDPRLLLEIAELTEDRDMPDQARAKLHKALGMAIGRAVDAAVAGETQTEGPAGGPKLAIEAALIHLRRAYALDTRSGVKKMIEQRERQLTKIAEDGAASAAST